MNNKFPVISYLFIGVLSLMFATAQAKEIKIPVAASADIVPETKNRLENQFDSGALVITNDTTTTVEDALFPEKTKNLAFSHFTWGAEFGSSIDLTGHNLSTFDLDLNFGFKNSFIKLAGVGVGIHRSIASGDNYIPVYAVFRSSFRKKPSLLFLNLQFGYSFNTIDNSPTFGDFSSAIGIGVNLMQSRRAKSYIILSAGSRYFNENHKSLVRLDTQYVYIGKLVIGVNF